MKEPAKPLRPTLRDLRPAESQGLLHGLVILAEIAAEIGRVVGIEGHEQTLVEHALGGVIGHGLDDAEPEIRQRADRERNLVAGEAGNEGLVLHGADPVIDPLDPQDVDRLPDIVRRAFLAGMGHQAETPRPSPA